MKPGRIDIPLVAAIEWGQNKHQAAWDKARRGAKFQVGQRVTNIKPLPTSIRSFDLPVDTRGIVSYVGTCENYEVEFKVEAFNLTVCCGGEQLKSIK